MYVSINKSVVFVVWVVFYASLLNVTQVHAAVTDWQKLNTAEYIAKRVQCQKVIEDFHWSHQLWPESNHQAKPLRSDVISDQQIEAKVMNNLAQEAALTQLYDVELDERAVHHELDRILETSQLPAKLGALFNQLDNDVQTIAECFIRPKLAYEGLAQRHDSKLQTFSQWWQANQQHWQQKFSYQPQQRQKTRTLKISTSNSIDSFTRIAPIGRTEHVAVWTGNEMLIWGGLNDNFNTVNTGGRYNPMTNTWQTTDTTQAPIPRREPMAVWTGTEMIVWGGFNGASRENTGGRYNPMTDTWTATSLVNVPDGVVGHSSVWTGNEMIIWGGITTTVNTNAGSRYNPSNDTWTATSVLNAPSVRNTHTAVWTGTEMIVWGGKGNVPSLNDGASYDPSTDVWTPISSVGTPSNRFAHKAVWTGRKMLVWGGAPFNTVLAGGLYNPLNDSWETMSTTDSPSPRVNFTSVWTGTDFIVWGGFNGSSLDTGGQYNLISDTWTPTNVNDAPPPRNDAIAVWTGVEMIIWGGFDVNARTNTGARYEPISDSWIVDLIFKDDFE